MPPTVPEPMARLPLRAELFLLAHDDDTGQPHLHPAQLTIGLAGAMLLELWLAKRIAIGFVYDPMTRRWIRQAGWLTVADESPMPDPLTNAALADAAHSRRTGAGQDQVRLWLRRFTVTDLYDRVRANMIAAGVLERATRRRFGLVKTDTYLAVHDAWAIRARAMVRDAVFAATHPGPHGYRRPDSQCAALCGLLGVLGLAEVEALYMNLPA